MKSVWAAVALAAGAAEGAAPQSDLVGRLWDLSSLACSAVCCAYLAYVLARVFLPRKDGREDASE